MNKFAVFVLSLGLSLAVQGVALAACTGAGTAANPYVCSSTAALNRQTGVGPYGSTTVDASSIPAGSKIQSIKVALNMNDPSPDDLFLLLVGPNNPNTENLIVSALVGCGTRFNGTINFADGSPNLPDCPSPTSGNTYEASANTTVGTNCGDPSVVCYTPTFSSGAPSTINYPQPFGSSTFSSQFHGANPSGTWTLYNYVASAGDGNGTISSWSVIIVLAEGAATSTTVAATPNPVFTSGGSNTATLTATVTSSPSNPTIGAVAFLDNGTTISGCGAVALGTSAPSGHAGGSNQAVCLETFMPSQEGTHIITANYTDSSATFISSSGTKGLQADNVTTNPGPGQYCNTGTVAVPNPINEASNPYPSHIYVPLTNAISAVTVTLNGVTTQSGDAGTLDLMVVAPDGTPFVPMNDVDGSPGENPITANNTTFTLSDLGVAFPFGGALANNQTYKPLTLIPAGNWPPSQTLAGPPAVTSSNFAENLGTATFATTFAGKVPNGSGSSAGNPWSLFIVSGLEQGTGGPAATVGGWCLNFVTSAGAATTTAVTSDDNPSITGTAVQFTATVTSSGLPVTSGTVTFAVDGTTAQGPVAVSGSGKATYTANALAEGTHTVQAFYNGVANSFNVSNGSLSQQVNTATVVSNNNTTFCNPGGISIPGSVGTATPYPSRVFVTNVPGTINSVTVNLKGFTMPVPETTDVLLVGPQASSENLVFMSQLGGSNTGENPVSDVNLTFADGGAAAPQIGQLVSATYAPTTYRHEAFTFGAPAPASPTFSSTLGAGTFASQFQGTAANGAWQLFTIQDETTSSAGSFGSWCLNLTVNPPAISVTKSHTGNFTQGQQGAQFSVNVSNAGPGPTAGTLTVTDILQSQFSPASTPGTGTDWNCSSSGQTITCTNSDSIQSGSSYPPLTLNVNVSPTATSTTNQVSIAGGGLTAPVSSNTDNITITVNPVLSVVKTHTGTFTQGQTVEWDVTVSNTAAGSTTSGVVTMQDTLPSGYTVSSFGSTVGTWTCNGIGTGTASCQTTQAVAGGSSFAPIQLIVNVPGASATSVTNTALAWGGGDQTHTSLGTAASGTDANVAVVQVATQMTALATSTPQSTTVGTAFPVGLTVLVEDAGNHPVQGVLVTFTAPTGAGIATGTFAGNLTTTTATTGANGIATASTFTANSKPGGPYTVTATAAGLPAVNFSLTNNAGAAATITINAGNNQSATVNTAFATNLQVTVTDSLSNPVSGVNVVFTAPSTGASGTFLGGSNSITVATNGSGIATAPAFTANGTPGGPYPVSVTAGSATPATFLLTNLSATIQATVGSNISGPTVSVDGGTPFTGSQVFTWTIGSIHTITTTSPQAGSTGTQYVWLNWSDGGAIAHSVTAPGTPTTYTANFKTQYLLTTAVAPSAADGTIAPATGYVDAGSIVPVSATANSGFTFSNFSGALTGSATPQNLTVSAPATVTANFATATIQATVGTNISGPTVSVDGGTPFTGSQIFTWAIGSNHTITTTSPQAGSAGTQYVWLNWSDSGAISHSVTAPGTAATYTANFKTQYWLTTAVAPSVSEGSISPASGYVDAGSMVPVSATANTGYSFTGFSGNLTGASTPQTLTVTAPATVTANFAPGATSLGGAIGLKSGPQNARVWPFTIGNNGPGAAVGAEITGLTLTQTSGAACTPVVSTPMPAVAGTISPAGTATVDVTIDFTGCPSNAFFKVTASLSANGGAAVGTITKLNQLQ
jgi:hypothetical protein